MVALPGMSRAKRIIKQVPNILSLSRIPLLFFITACLFIKISRRYLIAFTLSVVASITDYLDGATARRFNAVSDFGKLFDSLCDKILTVGIFISFNVVGVYPPIFVFPTLVVLSREFLVTGLRMIAASRGVVMAAERGGKLKTAAQMIAICATLLSYAIAEECQEKSSTMQKVLHVLIEPIRILGLIMFMVSSVLAFTSGWTYLRNYFYLIVEEPDPKHVTSGTTILISPSVSGQSNSAQAAAKSVSPASKPYDIISSPKSNSRISRSSSVQMQPEAADPACSPTLPGPPPPKFD